MEQTAELFCYAQMEPTTESQAQPSATNKHVRFAPDVQEKEFETEFEKMEQNNDIVISVMEFCPEDIQNSTIKRLFINVYKFR